MLYEKIRALLARQLELDPMEISPETNIIEDLGADSLDIVELLMTVEEEYGILIAEDEVHDMYTVRQVVDFVGTKI